MVNRQHYDLVILGAGSGGYAAARTARGLGAKVALVDHGPLGGLCILRGCMPSKTLLASSDLIADIAEAGVLGVDAGKPQIDFARIAARKKEIVAGFADDRIESLRSFPLYEGLARFLSPTELLVGDDRVLEAPRFVIATGSVVAPPALAGLAEAGYIDSDAALDLERLPASLLVLGGGFVAAELGQFFARMGVAVTMLFRAAHLFSSEDDDVGEAVTECFEREGIRIEKRVQFSHVEAAGGKKTIYFEIDGEARSASADEIFYALGRVPNVADLDLEKAGVAWHPITGIDIGLDLRTSNPNIFAVGDVTGDWPLVHIAIYQGEIAARNALTDGAELANYALQKAHTIFTDPQLAVAGETEKQLRAAGVAYLRGAYLFGDHGKAISINKTKGFVKILADPEDGKILGAAIVGAHASDLIHEMIVAQHFGATVYDFVKIPHLHPTMAEILTYPAEEIVDQLQALRLPAPPLPAPV
jgi:pyruvate/2-oxoglutarate dehydrogenase complex dihydrolipoamide dehydrogenase (E3) component